DELTKYRVEIWNEANTARLRDSGVQNATSGMKSSGIAEHTISPALAPGVYTIRATTYDKASVQSPTLVYKFQVNSGGAFTGVAILPADVAGETSLGETVTNSNTPRVTATWSHDDAESTATVSARI